MFRHRRLFEELLQRHFRPAGRGVLLFLPHDDRRRRTTTRMKRECVCVCVVLVLFAPALCAPFFNEENWKQKFFPKKKFRRRYIIYKYTHARAHVRKGFGVRSALLWLFSSSFSFSASSSGRARVGEREREKEK